MADVLHLYGNWKWTGPTELAVNLAEEQTKAAGSRVRMAFGRQRGADDHFTMQVGRRGIARVDGFELPKHFEPTSMIRDSMRLAKLLREEPPDVIHCHLGSDHMVAALARKLAKRKIPIVRSTYEAYGPGSTRRERYCLRTATDRLVVPCNTALDVVRTEGVFDPERVRVIEPAIDTNRFDRDRAVYDARAKFAIGRDAFVLGIVARVQARRRFDVFLEAARRLCERDPDAMVMILGGGTHQYEVARRPVEDMGLSHRILFPGVLRTDDYVAALRTFDVKAYMVPGTDGTCRAVKEAMCSGIPVIVANVGMLPELVTHQKAGLVFDGTPDGLDAAVERLRKNRRERLEMGDAAHADALARWRREPMRMRFEEVYSELCQRVGREV
jgi:glycosyltransferase involved in cell wall biosynthesis